MRNSVKKSKLVIPLAEEKISLSLLKSSLPQKNYYSRYSIRASELLIGLRQLGSDLSRARVRAQARVRARAR